jgi:hypothetical protein
VRASVTSILAELIKGRRLAQTSIRQVTARLLANQILEKTTDLRHHIQAKPTIE